MAPRDPKVFTITELDRIGGDPLGDGTQFAWVAEKRLPLQLNIDPLSVTIGVRQNSFAGAFAVPRRPWVMSGTQRTQRTDYPGARSPSEQILGPTHQPFSLDGRWDDRYNFPGFALQTRREFEKLARRGNAVRIQFINESFDCVITDWTFEYHREWDIRYEFSVSVHDRTDEADTATRSPDTTRNARQVFDDMTQVVEAIQGADTFVPDSFLATDIAQTIGDGIINLSQGLDSLEATLDSREATVTVQPVDPFRRLATQLRSMQTISAQMNTDLISVRADVDLGPKTAITVLNFEVWSRSIRFNNRVLIAQTLRASDEMDERASPNAIGFYRPFEGESLYNVARIFYGAPFGWRQIADRNNIPGIQLTGDELLIIPERAA